jgi:hypothetical protein
VCTLEGVKPISLIRGCISSHVSRGIPGSTRKVTSIVSVEPCPCSKYMSLDRKALYIGSEDAYNMLVRLKMGSLDVQSGDVTPCTKLCARNPIHERHVTSLMNASRRNVLIGTPMAENSSTTLRSRRLLA